MRYPWGVLILYSILVLCTLAVVGVAVFCYRHVRRHLRPEAAGQRPEAPIAPPRPPGRATLVSGEVFKAKAAGMGINRNDDYRLN